MILFDIYSFLLGLLIFPIIFFILGFAFGLFNNRKDRCNSVLEKVVFGLSVILTIFILIIIPIIMQNNNVDYLCGKFGTSGSFIAIDDNYAGYDLKIVCNGFGTIAHSYVNYIGVKYWTNEDLDYYYDKYFEKQKNAEIKVKKDLELSRIKKLAVDYCSKQNKIVKDYKYIDNNVFKYINCKYPAYTDEWIMDNNYIVIRGD